MRVKTTEELINSLVLIARLQALSVQFNEREPLIAANGITNRLITELVNELQAERTAAATITKVAK